VENGYTVPAVETLEKFARALEVPIYEIFYEGNGKPEMINTAQRNAANGDAWGSSGKDARMLAKFRRLLSQANDHDRKLLLFVAQKMVKRKTN
jgi:transcriptional regulator with XRE-family HTH domain